jgi:hypothetical protein
MLDLISLGCISAASHLGKIPTVILGRVCRLGKERCCIGTVCARTGPRGPMMRAGMCSWCRRRRRRGCRFPGEYEAGRGRNDGRERRWEDMHGWHGAGLGYVQDMEGSTRDARGKKRAVGSELAVPGLPRSGPAGMSCGVFLVRDGRLDKIDVCHVPFQFIGSPQTRTKAERTYTSPVNAKHT